MDAHLAKLRKAAILARRPLWRRALLRGVAATVEHRPLAKLVAPDTVIDVGANKGQFSLFALEAWPGCRVIAFEPLPGPAATYRALLAGVPSVRLVQAAVGPEAGPVAIHLAEREDSSSLLPIAERTAAIFPQARSAGRTVTAEAGPLARFVCPDELRGRVLLKLDVQGFELEALKGCEPFLEQIEHVYVECSYVELYRGQALIGEVRSFLNERGFGLVAEINLVAKSGVGKIQSDCLFSRLANASQELR